jgi:hypothetical protein
MTAPLNVTFDPNATLTADNKLVLTGTFAGDNVKEVDLLADGTELGSAQISHGDWTFTTQLGSTASEIDYEAQVVQTTGVLVQADASFSVETGIKNKPYTTEFITKNSDGDSGTINLFKADATPAYHVNFGVNNSGTGGSEALTETGDGLRTHFVYVSDFGTQQKITNFHLTGRQHDVVIMPSGDFSNMAEILRNTTNSHGNAIISDPNNLSRLTLVGISKAELKAHPHDFSFNGDGHFG